MTHELEGRLARVLTIGTWVSVAILVAGSGLTAVVVAGSTMAALPEALLWAGIALVILTPIARVAVAAVGFERRGERELAALALAVLAVLAVTVVVGVVA